MAPVVVSLEHRFWAKVQRTDTCWLWQGTVRADGQPVIRAGGRMQTARRVAWELTHGVIPARHQVIPGCETLRCMRHLALRPPATNRTAMPPPPTLAEALALWRDPTVRRHRPVRIRMLLALARRDRAERDARHWLQQRWGWQPLSVYDALVGQAWLAEAIRGTLRERLSGRRKTRTRDAPRPASRGTGRSEPLGSDPRGCSAGLAVRAQTTV